MVNSHKNIKNKLYYLLNETSKYSGFTNAQFKRTMFEETAFIAVKKNFFKFLMHFESPFENDLNLSSVTSIE